MYQTIFTNLHEIAHRATISLIDSFNFLKENFSYSTWIHVSRRATWFFNILQQIIEVNEVKKTSWRILALIINSHEEKKHSHRKIELENWPSFNCYKCNLPCSQDVALGKHCPWMVSHAYDWFYQAPAILVLCVNVVFLFMIMWVSTMWIPHFYLSDERNKREWVKNNDTRRNILSKYFWNIYVYVHV